MVGTSGRDVFYEARPAAAFADVLEAMASVGKVLESSDRTKTVTGSVRYGLQRVKLRISVLPAAGGSTISVQASSDDIWGAGARKGADKLIRALG